MNPAKTQPALLGGITIGVLSALPVINCCCCAWILFGGGLAAYLVQQNQPAAIEIGDGAVVGLMAGVVGAFTWLIASMLISTATAPFEAALVQQALRDTTDLPPFLREALESARSGGTGMGIGVVFGFFVMLVLMTTGGMLGGIFGALLFRKNQPPVIPPPPPIPSF
jgi:hypothetical protein